MEIRKVVENVFNTIEDVIRRDSDFGNIMKNFEWLNSNKEFLIHNLEKEKKIYFETIKNK